MYERTREDNDRKDIGRMIRLLTNIDETLNPVKASHERHRNSSADL